MERKNFALYFKMLAVLCGVVHVHAGYENCSSDFSSQCQCGEEMFLNKRQYVVNCTNTGFRDALLLQRLPPRTQVLIFNGNVIKDLPWNVFGTLNNFEQLRVVDMSNNCIQEIRGKSYHRVANVERLILNHNQISISSGEPNHHHPRVFSNFENLVELHLTDAFADNSPEDLASDLHDIFFNSDLSQLRKLHLEQNEITQFQDPRVFCDLPNLQDLHLGQNSLQGIHFELSCLTQLRFLDLERNKIRSLSDEDMATLDWFPEHNRSLTIDISDNPLTCDCHRFYSWLQNTKVEVRNKNKLHCRNDDAYCSSRSALMAPVLHSEDVDSDSGLIIFLTVSLLISLSLLVYTNKVPIQRNTRIFFEAITKKVHYTNIGKQEEQEMDV